MTPKIFLGLAVALFVLAGGGLAYAQQNINIPSITSQEFANATWSFSINNQNYTLRGSDLITMFRSNCSTPSANDMICRISGSQGTLTLTWTGSGAGNLGTGGSLTLSRDLSRGMSGDDVRGLQLFLIEEGYLAAGNNTGFFGPLTEAAVMQFQTRVGLAATGYVGPLTRAQINSM